MAIILGFLSGILYVTRDFPVPQEIAGIDDHFMQTEGLANAYFKSNAEGQQSQPQMTYRLNSLDQ
jgi:hypothetical protein